MLQQVLSKIKNSGMESRIPMNILKQNKIYHNLITSLNVNVKCDLDEHPVAPHKITKHSPHTKDIHLIFLLLRLPATKG